MIKIINNKNKLKNAKPLSEEALKYLRKEEKVKAKGKRKDIPICTQSSKEWHREIRKPFPVISAKK